MSVVELAYWGTHVSGSGDGALAARNEDQVTGSNGSRVAHGGTGVGLVAGGAG